MDHREVAAGHTASDKGLGGKDLDKFCSSRRIARRTLEARLHSWRMGGRQHYMEEGEGSRMVGRKGSELAAMGRRNGGGSGGRG